MARICDICNKPLGGRYNPVSHERCYKIRQRKRNGDGESNQAVMNARLDNKKLRYIDEYLATGILSDWLSMNLTANDLFKLQRSREELVALTAVQTKEKEK